MKPITFEDEEDATHVLQDVEGIQSNRNAVIFIPRGTKLSLMQRAAIIYLTGEHGYSVDYNSI